MIWWDETALRYYDRKLLSGGLDWEWVLTRLWLRGFTWYFGFWIGQYTGAWESIINHKMHESHPFLFLDQQRQIAATFAVCGRGFVCPRSWDRRWLKWFYAWWTKYFSPQTMFNLTMPLLLFYSLMSEISSWRSHELWQLFLRCVDRGTFLDESLQQLTKQRSCRSQ